MFADAYKNPPNAKCSNTDLINELLIQLLGPLKGFGH